MAPLGITHTTLLPVHVQTFLAATPVEFVPKQQIKLFSTGAPLSASLRDRAVARLGAELKNSYGTNETGTVAWFGLKGDGEVLAGVDVEIVDAALNVLPRGVPGRVRVRSSEVARGYLDADLTRERFIDGWFLTDDVGIMHGPRELTLVGRSDTMINIGGTKVLPEEIEELLTQRAIARDIAVCTLPNKDGVDELYIAIAEPKVESHQMIDAVRSCLGPNFGHIRLVLTDLVPRNAQGKIMRKVLKENVGAKVGRV
jgi:fatty-acyl-CoA synthase